MAFVLMAFVRFLPGSFVHLTGEFCVGLLSDVWLLEFFT